MLDVVVVVVAVVTAERNWNNTAVAFDSDVDPQEPAVLMTNDVLDTQAVKVRAVQ